MTADDVSKLSLPITATDIFQEVLAEQPVL